MLASFVKSPSGGANWIRSQLWWKRLAKRQGKFWKSIPVYWNLKVLPKSFNQWKVSRKIVFDRNQSHLGIWPIDWLKMTQQNKKKSQRKGLNFLKTKLDLYDNVRRLSRKIFLLFKSQGEARPFFEGQKAVIFIIEQPPKMSK